MLRAERERGRNGTSLCLTRLGKGGRGRSPVPVICNSTIARGERGRSHVPVICRSTIVSDVRGRSNTFPVFNLLKKGGTRPQQEVNMPECWLACQRKYTVVQG